MMKQIPYGITDFSRIQKENYYYVDKTMFIEKIAIHRSASDEAPQSVSHHAI